LDDVVVELDVEGALRRRSSRGWDRARRRGRVWVNGRDQFGSPDDLLGLACRIYRTRDGVEQVPRVEQLDEGLAEARWPLNSWKRCGLTARRSGWQCGCCGRLILLNYEAGVTVAGVGLRGWLLGAADLVAGAGVWRYRRRASSTA